MPRPLPAKDLSALRQFALACGHTVVTKQSQIYLTYVLWSVSMIVNGSYDCEARRTLLAKLRMVPANATSIDYRERARRIRALADETTFPQIKRELLEVAVENERLAVQAEGRGMEPVRTGQA